MAGTIMMEPEYIYGTVPRPQIEIIKLSETHLPWIIGAGVAVAGLLYVAVSKGHKRRSAARTRGSRAQARRVKRWSKAHGKRRSRR